MIDVKKTRAMAVAALNGPGRDDVVASDLAALLDEALAEIESLRINLGRHDAASEERLMRYRCAAMPGIMSCYSDAIPPQLAEAVETMAHAMLAAERPAEASARRDPEPMPGSLSDQVAAYLAAGNESTFEHIAEQLHSSPVDVLDALTDLHDKGKADIVAGSKRWAKVPR